MMFYYATHDSDSDGYVEEDAYIAKFETREAAVAYLRDRYDPDEFDVEIASARGFNDAWLKLRNRPRVADPLLSPFSYTQLSILEPGQHPGGKVYWVTPGVDMLIARVKEKEPV